MTYTYLHVRMKSNPLAYGLTYRSLENDPSLEIHREDLIKIAGKCFHFISKLKAKEFILNILKRDNWIRLTCCDLTRRRVI